MKTMVILRILLVLGLWSLQGADSKDPHFFEKPYLQLGDRVNSSRGDLDLHWLSHDRDAKWTVEYRDGGPWRTAKASQVRRVEFEGTPAHRVMVAPLIGLKANTRFDYRLKVDDKPIFEASAMSRKDTKTASRAIIFGDCSANTEGQRGVAYYSAKEKADYVFITGDIVYSRGRVSEYQEKFWPVYNHETADPKAGSPLLRSTLLAGVVGNHDVGTEIDFDKTPDALAYYLYWNQPRNGPALALNQKNTPKVSGSSAAIERFVAAAGKDAFQKANFSFDYGQAHWTVLDSNSYTDWTTPEFRNWLKADLAAARQAKWKIVAFHHPPFNSSKAHFNEQRMRVIADLLEEGGVSVVFSGHVHNYQRTFPLKFAVEPGFVLGKEQKVPGKWSLDKSFDGKENTKLGGVLYIVTGAGGANLYNEDQSNKPESWQEFTTKFVSNVHSFSVLDVDSTKLVLRQVSSKGEELDKIVITK